MIKVIYITKGITFYTKYYLFNAVTLLMFFLAKTVTLSAPLKLKLSTKVEV